MAQDNLKKVSKKVSILSLSWENRFKTAMRKGDWKTFKRMLNSISLDAPKTESFMLGKCLHLTYGKVDVMPFFKEILSHNIGWAHVHDATYGNPLFRFIISVNDWNLYLYYMDVVSPNVEELDTLYNEMLVIGNLKPDFGRIVSKQGHNLVVDIDSVSISDISLIKDVAYWIISRKKIVFDLENRIKATA